MANTISNYIVKLIDALTLIKVLSNALVIPTCMIQHSCPPGQHKNSLLCRSHAKGLFPRHPWVFREHRRAPHSIFTSGNPTLPRDGVINKLNRLEIGCACSASTLVRTLPPSGIPPDHQRDEKKPKRASQPIDSVWEFDQMECEGDLM